MNNFNFNFNFIHSISIYNFTIASTRVLESLIEAGEETHKFKERKEKKKYFTKNTSCRKIKTIVCIKLIYNNMIYTENISLVVFLS